MESAISNSRLSEEYRVHPLKTVEGEQIRVSVPGSKSITNRALLLAALGNGVSTVKGILFSDDSRHFLSCLKDLGFDVKIDELNKSASITGLGGAVPNKKAKIDVGSAGTAARFLTAFLGMSPGTYEIQASQQMKKRPMDSLFNSLKELGAKIQFLEEPGHLPVVIGNDAISSNEVTVDIEKSSQFLSALLISSCLCKNDFTIHMKGEHGRAYIDLTVKMIREFGGEILRLNDKTYKIPASMSYVPMCYQVEPDVSAACYFYAMAPLLGRDVLVNNVHLDLAQGDLEFIKLMEKLGCRLHDTKEGLILYGNKNLKYDGILADLGAFSDQAMTLAALAVFASSPTTITGISHIRYQESDRILAMANELNRMGIKTEIFEDGIYIEPGIPKPAKIETYDDHRMAMAFSLVGLRSEGIIIKNPACCSKTFEDYFDILGGISF